MGVARVRLIVGVAVLGLILALVLGSAGLFGAGRALGSSTTITVIGGDVSIRHGATSSFAAAVDGEILNPGDTVKTGADGRAVLTYFEGSTVSVEPNTELTIDAAAAQGNDTIVQMTQTVGRTWHVVTKLVTGSSKYEVRTPASTASVRGTAFTVDADTSGTTITTTEGTVLDEVPDPANPGRTIDVPVPAGQQHSQARGQGAGPTRQTPAPDRKVTMTISDQNTIVIDTLGRANGFDENGKKKLQTPGATLEVVDGHLVITLPNIPPGLLTVLTRTGAGDVDVTTVVTDHGTTTSSSAKLNSANGRGSVDVSGKPGATPATGGPGGGNPPASPGAGQGNPPSAPGATPNPGGIVPPAPSGGGFVPQTALPTIPVRPTNAPSTPVPGAPSAAPPGGRP